MDKIGYDDNGMNDYRFLEIFYCQCQQFEVSVGARRRNEELPIAVQGSWCDDYLIGSVQLDLTPLVTIVLSGYGADGVNGITSCAAACPGATRPPPAATAAAVAAAVAAAAASNKQTTTADASTTTTTTSTTTPTISGAATAAPLQPPPPQQPNNLGVLPLATPPHPPPLPPHYGVEDTRRKLTLDDVKYAVRLKSERFLPSSHIFSDYIKNRVDSYLSIPTN
ncbi:hypothetical protein OUZ56_000768 [Daphnia magna]|uniref:Uncharacterized protein n=1 Tax=Daphnia magna TaxID=35525 RepID=A0ABR0A0P1_9CRUS|nr:hypothetical protein OUZ56_000768 [Daphnia magna]